MAQPAHFDPAKRLPLIETEQNLSAFLMRLVESFSSSGKFFFYGKFFFLVESKCF